MLVVATVTFARALVAAGIDCALLEPGVDGALAAHARGIDPVICATLEDIALPPSSIAAAGLFDVLEHIKDDVAALQRVHKLLRPGGRLVLTVPAYPLLYSADDTVAGHFRRYTRTTLLSALQASRFRSEFASYLFAPLPPLIFLLRTVRHASVFGVPRTPKTLLLNTDPAAGSPHHGSDAGS